MSPDTRLRPPRPLLSAEVLAELEDQLRSRLRMLKANVRGLDEAARGSGLAGDLSNLPVHPADIASDAFETDMSLGLMEGQLIEMGHIKAALERMDEGTYGLCENCDRAIALDRLQAIPYARLCVECKRKEEGIS